MSSRVQEDVPGPRGRGSEGSVAGGQFKHRASRQDTADSSLPARLARALSLGRSLWQHKSRLPGGRVSEESKPLFPSQGVRATAQ